MRGATQCARRLKQLLRSLRAKLGKVARPLSGDAVTQMILGIFSRDVPQSKAREALDRLRTVVVDYNELRVVPPIEMTEMIGELPNARLKCEDLSRALNRIFACEHEVSLDRLSGLRKKEVTEYLDAIDGLDAYSRARVRLLGLQQHAVPLDEAMWAYVRKAEVVDKKCSLKEAQAFLERRVPEGEAPEFVALLEKQAWAEMGAAVRNREVEPITSVPPDRTARNMLQLIASGRSAASAPQPPEHDEVSQARAETQGAKTADRSRAVKSVAASRKGRKPEKLRRKAARRPKAAKSSAKRKAREHAKRDEKARTKARAKAKAKAKARTKRRRKPAGRVASRTKRTVRAKVAKRIRRSAPRAKSA